MIQNKIYHRLYTYFHKFFLQDTGIISLAKNGIATRGFFSFWYFSDFFNRWVCLSQRLCSYRQGIAIAEKVGKENKQNRDGHCEDDGDQ